MLQEWGRGLTWVLSLGFELVFYGPCLKALYMPARKKEPTLAYVVVAFIGICFFVGLAKIGKGQQSTKSSQDSYLAPSSPGVVNSPPNDPSLFTAERKTAPKEALNFIPPTVTLSRAVAINSPATGQALRTFPSGTILKVKAIKSGNVVLDFGSGTGEVPATATNLVEEMSDQLEHTVTGP